MGNGCARCFRKESHGGEAYAAVPGNSNAHNISAHKSRNNEAYEPALRSDITRNYANQNANFVIIGDGTNLSDAVVNDGEFQLTHSISQVQHISDRDPQALSAPVPSDNPRCKTLFLNKARRELNRAFRNKRAFREQSSYSIVSSGAVSQASVASTLHRRASTSSVYANDSSVSQPNLKIAIKTVSLAVYFHIKNRAMQPAVAGGDRQTSPGRSLPIFDEREHPMNREPVPSDYATREPDHKVIYRFVRNLFSSAQLTAECAIVTLVYLERLLTYAELEIAPANWKRILLGSILLASKVWDDQAVWNVDYCQILKDLLVDDVNELERQFLEAIEFNIDVPSNVYAKYYFDLRVLADAYELSGSYAPLSKERAAKLEAAGHVGTHSHTPLKECAKDILHFATLKRTRSFDSLFIKLPIDYFIIS